jgi:protocatechuate 3,4-dioxygenase beta subunit
MSRLRRIGAAFVCFVAFTHAARAQVPRTGELHGTVTDQTGAVVVGASVVLSSDAGQNWSQSTDGLGRYKFTDMPPGTYDL